MRYAIAAAFVIAGLPVAAPAADVYRSVDAQGHVLYSDTPSPGAQLISVNGDDSSSTPAASSANSAADAAAAASDADQQIARQEAQRTVQQTMAQKRSDECKQAQAQYQQSVQARRIFTTGPDGQRQYLSDADADRKRADQLLQMQTLCKDAQ